MDPKMFSELNRNESQNPNLIALKEALMTGKYPEGETDFKKQLLLLSAPDLWDLRQVNSDPRNPEPRNMNAFQIKWSRLLEEHMIDRELLDNKKVA